MKFKIQFDDIHIEHNLTQETTAPMKAERPPKSDLNVTAKKITPCRDFTGVPNRYRDHGVIHNTVKFNCIRGY